MIHVARESFTSAFVYSEYIFAATEIQEYETVDVSSNQLSVEKSKVGQTFS